MSDNLVARIIDKHTRLYYEGDFPDADDRWCCNCGWTWTAGGTYGEHVATLINRQENIEQTDVE